MWAIFNYLTLDFIVGIVIVCLFIYFVAIVKKKKYKYIGIEGSILTSSISKKKKKKKTPKKSEDACRKIFEELFGVPFKTIRPKWLENPMTGWNLELDGFNKNIPTSIGKGLAFEYDGEQHAKYSPHFHKNNPQNFLYQRKKDAWKDLKCKQYRIVLIRIPYYVTPASFKSFIIDSLRKARVDIPNLK